MAAGLAAKAPPNLLQVWSEDPKRHLLTALWGPTTPLLLLLFSYTGRPSLLPWQTGCRGVAVDVKGQDADGVRVQTKDDSVKGLSLLISHSQTPGAMVTVTPTRKEGGKEGRKEQGRWLPSLHAAHDSCRATRPPF